MSTSGLSAQAQGAGDMPERSAILLCAVMLAGLGLVPLIGNHGLWAALMVLNLTRSVTMARAWPGVIAGSGPDQAERG